MQSSVHFANKQLLSSNQAQNHLFSKFTPSSQKAHTFYLNILQIFYLFGISHKFDILSYENEIRSFSRNITIMKFTWNQHDTRFVWYGTQFH